MSGPYRCLFCSGTGLVEVGRDLERVEPCEKCKGSGERWLETVFSPSREDRALGRVEYVDGRWRFKDPA